jgi:hypothetical protein
MAMKKISYAALAAMLMVPAALAAQTSVSAVTSVSARAEAGRDDRAETNADVSVRAAADAGLPAEVVARAAADARAYGASEAQAARAAADACTRLAVSRAALGSGGDRQPAQAEIAAGARAMAAGASQADLSVLARRAPERRSLTASLDALARLGARSGDFHGSAAAIAAQLGRNASDRAITSLAATGSVDAMLRGGSGGLDAAASLGASATSSVGGVLNAGGSLGGSVSGAVGGLIP